ncbi:SWIM-type domain-containing protein [Citrus sinensis]|uniref:SWIM-type domain-containing protein n=1 Tax=Citrus sinensis TaxID=2711 RepID=A0ACB8MU71_CITSI|nr:SWIM-type domain-containing protein [Citrus sinensis]
MNLENKVKIVLDYDLGLKCLTGIHNLMGLTTFEVDVIPVLCPQYPDSLLIHSLLFNLGIQLPSEVINTLNDHFTRVDLERGTPKVSHSITDEDELLSNRSDKRIHSDDDEDEDEEVAVQPPPAEDDLLSDWSDKEINNDDDGGEPCVRYTNDVEPVEDSDDNEGSDSDADVLLDDDTREVEMVVNSSDEDKNAGSVQFRDYLEKHEYKLDADGIHKLRMSDVFRDVGHFREVLHEMMVRKGFNINIKYSEPRRYYATCKEPGCPWFVNGGRLNDRNGFWLRGYHKKHECRFTKQSVKVTSTWIAEMIKEHVAIDLNVKISILKTYMQEKFRLKIEKLTMYRARERVRILVYGDQSKGYQKLFQYAAAIHQANPGAMCKVLCDTGKYSGVLLAAVAADANKGIVSLALSICEIENTETWSWFLEHLHNYFDDGRHVTFINDRQKGLLNAIPNTLPFAYHMACCRHVCANFARDHAGAKLRNLFWRAAKSSNKHDFDEAMALIKDEKIEAYNWLERELQGYTWSMHAYDKNCKVIDKAYYPARRFIVKLEDKTCDCGYWEIADLPCSHAMASIGYARHETEEYIPFCFTKQAYINTYSVMFSLIPDEHTWERGERPLIDPPIVQKKIRRPKKCRKRAATEPKKRSRKFFVNCSVCGGSNHNIRSCPLRNTTMTNSVPSGPGEGSSAGSKKWKSASTAGTNKIKGRAVGVSLSRGEGSSAGSKKRKSASIAGTNKIKGRYVGVSLSTGEGSNAGSKKRKTGSTAGPNRKKVSAYPKSTNLKILHKLQSYQVLCNEFDAQFQFP